MATLCEGYLNNKEKDPFMPQQIQQHDEFLGDERRSPLTEMYPILDTAPFRFESQLLFGENDLLRQFDEFLSTDQPDIPNDIIPTENREHQPEPIVVYQVDYTPKKRGRRPKKRADSVKVKPSKKRVVKAVKYKSHIEKVPKRRKSMDVVEKAQHNNMERERRKGMTALMDELRELVPAVEDDKRASQKKIIDEATTYLKKEKPVFLSYLKERQRCLHLENMKRQLEWELASKHEGVLCVWEERRGMSTGDLYKKVKKEASEEIRDDETDEAIRVLESYSYRSPESSPSYSDSPSDDPSDDEEHIDVEV